MTWLRVGVVEEFFFVIFFFPLQMFPDFLSIFVNFASKTPAGVLSHCVCELQKRENIPGTLCINILGHKKT